MEEKIIKLAEEKGFIGADYNIYTAPFGATPKEIYDARQLEYYLWLCELQQWLRENNCIYVFILRAFKEWSYEIIYKDEYHISQQDSKSYEDMLADGCFEALKLIE